MYQLTGFTVLYCIVVELRACESCEMCCNSQPNSRCRPKKHSQKKLRLHLNSHLSLSRFLYVGDFLLEEVIFLWAAVSQGYFLYIRGKHGGESTLINGLSLC